MRTGAYRRAGAVAVFTAYSAEDINSASTPCGRVGDGRAGNASQAAGAGDQLRQAGTQPNAGDTQCSAQYIGTTS